MSTTPSKRRYSIDAPDQQRLKIARAEIEGVLKKHDLGGVVVLHTPGMTEFFYDITPSYSCAWIEGSAAKPLLRVKSKAADHGGDVRLQVHDQAATANMMHGFESDLLKAATMFASVALVVDRKVRAEHADEGFRPDPMEAKKQ